MKKLSISFLLSVSCVVAAGAPSYQFRHYTTREGLSSNTVRAMIQDRAGMIWIGTSEGLDSFDGREVIAHSIPPGGSRYVNSLMEDSSGTLWVGTDDAVYRYCEDTLTRISGIPEAIINCMAQDRSADVWIGTDRNGLFRWRGPEMVSHYLENRDVANLFVSEDGRLWAAVPSSDEGLLVFNPSTGSFVDPGFHYAGCSPTRICALEQDMEGNLWLGTWNKGLYKLDYGTRTVRCAVPYGKGLNHIHSLKEESPWCFLVGSDDGLLRVNPLTGEQILYSNDRRDESSLSNKFVYPVITDHEGGIWAGTYYGGVNYVSPGIGQFSSRSLSALTQEEETFTAGCFAEDPDGTLWIGSDNGGLFHYNPANSDTERILNPAILQSLNIHSLLREGDYLWIGTYSANLLRMDVRTRAIKPYRENLPSVYSLHMSADGGIWAGTTSGICRYSPDEDRFVTVRDMGSTVTAIDSHSDGSIWFASNGEGILCLSADGTWSTVTMEESALPSNHVNCLYATSNGVFAGTQKGFVRLADGEGKAYLESSDIQYMVHDGKDIWLSSPASLMRFTIENGAVEVFGSNDGVTPSQFLPGAGCVLRDGQIFLGGSDGFVSFYPSAVKTNPKAPTVLFTRFTASAPGMVKDIFRTQPRDNIRIPWQMRELYITFSALTYWAPEKVRFSYWLEGLDREWKDNGNWYGVNLSRLPAGHYTLHVRACNNSGVWNMEGGSLSFTIQPHPLRSNMAIAIYVLIFGILVWLGVRQAVRMAERKSRASYEIRLDKAVSQMKEEEKDDRIQFLTSITDQLEAPVASIGLQLDSLKESGSPKGDLAVLEKNHRMLKNLTTYLKQTRAKLSEGRSQEVAVSQDGRAEEDFSARLDHLIHENLSNPDLSVQFLAKEMAISRSGLFAKCKEACDETPNNLINQARLNEAANLLTEGRYTIGEICYMVGFSSPSYFSKSFTAQFGLTPHEWAKRQGE